jgi:predicted Zn-dependent protease
MKRLLAIALTVGVALAGGTPAAAQSNDNQVEMQIGQQEYQLLQQKGEIISSSPYYAILNPIAQQIKRVADPQYFHPFNFILVHESAPNAFAVPGGNVYVTDSLMKFVQNREELAGVLCHETSHNIHHDVLHLYQKQQHVGTTVGILDILANVATGGKYSRTIDTAASLGFQFQTLHFSRDVEAAADATGARTCAAADSNPWGMVWLFKRFETLPSNGMPNFLSDHPSDEARIASLQAEFRDDPALFTRFSSNIANATPLGQSVRSTTTSYRPVTKKPKGMFPPGSGYKY